MGAKMDRGYAIIEEGNQLSVVDRQGNVIFFEIVGWFRFFARRRAQKAIDKAVSRKG